ncbi:MAG: hypothetical protein AAB396_02505 [Patescibacteria group bacterium]
MEKKAVKQIIYGAGFLAVLFLFFITAYFIWLKPAATCFDNKKNQNETGVDCGGACTACEIRTLAPIEMVWERHFQTDSQTAIAIEIKNSNITYGADKFLYNIDIYGKNGNKLKNISGNTFIYSSEIKYLVEFSDIKSSDIGEIKISFDNINWKTDGEFPRPKAQIREKSTIGREGGGVEINGIVVNDNAYPLSKIKLVGFLSTQNGIKIGVSKTELSNIAAFEEKSFKMIFPKNISIASMATSTQFEFAAADPNKTQIFIESVR